MQDKTKVAQYYPFSPSSTMQIMDGVPLPYGLVYGALLYPRIVGDDNVGALHVSAMYTRFDPFEHHWTVTNATNTITVDVVFSAVDRMQQGKMVLPAGLSEDSNSTGWVLQNGMCRGALRCKPGFLSYVENLPVNLELPDDALIFDPAVVRFRQNAGFQAVKDPSEDDYVKCIKFDTKSFKEDTGVTVPLTTEVTLEQARIPIKRIYLDSTNYIEATKKVRNVEIVAKRGSGVKVVTEGTTIKVGRGMYL